MGDFPSYQKLQCVLGAGVITEVDQPLVNDFGPSFGGNVATEIDIKFAGDLEINRRPGIALGVEQIDAAAPGDRDQRIGFRRFAIEF